MLSVQTVQHDPTAIDSLRTVGQVSDSVCLARGASGVS
jgi:hypothetical protein